MMQGKGPVMGRPALGSDKLEVHTIRVTRQTWRWYKLNGGLKRIRAVLVAHQKAAEDGQQGVHVNTVE